jgi:hypothetical protein
MSTTVDTSGLDPVADAALILARDAAEGQITMATVEQAAADRCRALFSTVVGPGDPLWELHCDVTRQAIALGAVSASELGEWAAVIRQREGRST